MPVICVKSLPLNKPMTIGSVLKKLNNEVAAAIDYDPSHIWSYWQFIERHMYAAGDSIAAVIQKETHSPIVEVIGFEGKSQELIEKMLKTIADVLAEGLTIERSNIFITYFEAKSGSVFDGGEIVYKK
jgi:hypothetical protein